MKIRVLLSDSAVYAYYSSDNKCNLCNLTFALFCTFEGNVIRFFLPCSTCPSEWGGKYWIEKLPWEEMAGCSGQIWAHLLPPGGNMDRKTPAGQKWTPFSRSRHISPRPSTGLEMSPLSTEMQYGEKRGIRPAGRKAFFLANSQKTHLTFLLFYSTS